jgi:hypothetical protein
LIMNTLTQVWVFSLAICSVILISFFKMGGRLGLFVGFILSLGLIYLLLHKGLRFFLDQIKAELHKGSDPAGINSYILKHRAKYHIQKYFLHYTNQASHPMVWRNFKNEVHIVLNKTMVENLDSDEKNLLSHLMLAHASIHSKFRRRLLSVLFLALSPLSTFLAPLFNLTSKILQLQKQIISADLYALKASDSVSQEKMNDFSLFLRKLHNLKFHKLRYRRGENYFSILSTSSRSAFSLKLCPPLEIRLKNLIGEPLLK